MIGLVCVLLLVLLWRLAQIGAAIALILVAVAALILWSHEPAQPVDMPGRNRGVRRGELAPHKQPGCARGVLLRGPGRAHHERVVSRAAHFAQARASEPAALLCRLCPRRGPVAFQEMHRDARHPRGGRPSLVVRRLEPPALGGPCPRTARARCGNLAPPGQRLRSALEGQRPAKGAATLAYRSGRYLYHRWRHAIGPREIGREITQF